MYFFQIFWVFFVRPGTSIITVVDINRDVFRQITLVFFKSRNEKQPF